MATKSIHLRKFLQVLLGNKPERKIGQFILKKQKSGGIGVFIKNSYEFYNNKKPTIKQTEKFKIKQEKILSKLKHEPISDEELLNIE